MIILIATFSWTTVLTEESLIFILTPFQFFFLGNSINTFQWNSKEHGAKALRYVYFHMVNEGENQSKPLNAYKVSVQTTSLQQILIWRVIGKCMCRVREQLITIYTNGSTSIKIFKFVTYAQLFAAMFGKWFKGYKSNSCIFLSHCPGEGRDPQFYSCSWSLRHNF